MSSSHTHCHAHMVVGHVYRSVVNDTIAAVRSYFLDEGLDEQVLQELKQLWESKLRQSRVVPGENDTPSAGATTGATTGAGGGGASGMGAVTVTPSKQRPLQRSFGAGAAVGAHHNQHQQQQSSASQQQLVPIQITIPAQGPGGASKTIIVQVPVSAVQSGLAGQFLQTILSSPAAQATFALPPDVAGQVLQRQLNDALRQSAAASATAAATAAAVTTAPTIPTGGGGTAAATVAPSAACRVLPGQLDGSDDSDQRVACAAAAADTVQVGVGSFSVSVSLPALDNSPSQLMTLSVDDSYQHGDAAVVAGDDDGTNEQLPSDVIYCATIAGVSASTCDCPTSTATAVADATATRASSDAATAAAATATVERRCGAADARVARRLLSGRPAARPLLVVQLDGAADSSDSDDDDGPDDDVDDDDDDPDLVGDDVDDDDDDVDDEDDDDEDGHGREEEPLNSEDDVSDHEPVDLKETFNVMVCQYDKISRSRNKWKFYLKDGIMNLDGKDYIFQKATGDAEW